MKIPDNIVELALNGIGIAFMAGLFLYAVLLTLILAMGLPLP